MAALRIGLISDTHDLLRPEAVAYLHGADHIIHAGDICDEGVLRQLAVLAPLTVVRGNNDRGAWAAGLREVEWLQLGGATIYVIHDLAALDVAPAAAGVQVVVSGHSHKPCVEWRDGVLYANPGSAGPRRFSLPISIGELHLDGGQVSARTATLNVAAGRFVAV